MKIATLALSILSLTIFVALDVFLVEAVYRTAHELCNRYNDCKPLSRLPWAELSAQPNPAKEPQ